MLDIKFFSNKIKVINLFNDYKLLSKVIRKFNLNNKITKSEIFEIHILLLNYNIKFHLISITLYFLKIYFDN